MMMRVPDKTSTFSPAANYALWCVSGNAMSMKKFSRESLQVEHIIGPLLGAIVAGYICIKLFPDDPTSWKRKLS
jgi:hypothetical protein